MRSFAAAPPAQGARWLRTAPARLKLLAVLLFAVIVVATPREWFAAFALYAAVVAGFLLAARVTPRTLLARMGIEIPFLVFAVLMPFVATGPRVDVWGLQLSVEGLWGGWGLLAKATLALMASIVLVSTTEPRAIILALEQLHLPRQLTAIAGFMLRYLDVIVGEWRRMRVAQDSRGFGARGHRSWPVLARGVGALFTRSHGRGERVHLAMLSRGYLEPARA
ncbi:cobalt ECF transporter T component CbiQ [Microbacterium sp. zg.Y1090]|uniref:cobalt ECF transporter T component CbiQ n=1 Tax=Microbacterium TaxID=33882 RepID=UPI00214AFECA|nr:MULTISPECIES: cobalt ECF transporter T component CbiQ [unclassified Microbacterium]MCR2811559.1 cobalt ECF transporter T component CbiQ [Microbacterium sp. zg.Y1084]MCR2819019.1 cobalt ECF transporter T component CbiQ [Microbacterium sp. zg.Y1090]MDL5487669.1 cobalt ECF transporter T component CbiQ [Microbacterium sp. zg-Y1211]WIM27324.1 cobalt ECF transporter T component CbiQ [Microbacterium sp. zg-Y1090]